MGLFRPLIWYWFNFGIWYLSRKLSISSRFSSFVEYSLLYVVGSDDVLDFLRFCCYVSFSISNFVDLDTVQLSPESQWSEYSLQASSPLTGKVHRGLVFRPAYWLKMKVWNRACPRKCVASAVCTLTWRAWSLRDPGHKIAPSPAPAVRALPGGHLFSGGEGAQMSGAWNRVCPRSCATSAVCWLTLRSPRAVLCRLVSKGPGTQDVSLTCSGSQSPTSRFFFLMYRLLICVGSFDFSLELLEFLRFLFCLGFVWFFGLFSCFVFVLLRLGSFYDTKAGFIFLSSNNSSYFSLLNTGDEGFSLNFFRKLW
jgi:hypothetical protein